MKLRPRAVPLVAHALIARGDAALALARKLREGAPAGLRGVRWAGAIALFVDTPEQLPWIDGAEWLGREPLAPSLFVPTRLEVTPHPQLVHAALARKLGADHFPLAIVPAGARVEIVPLGSARAPSARGIDAFLGARS
jgi:hypothetical protein